MLSEQVEYERRNADKVPLTSQRCFHPVRVFNRFMNEYIYVNCRKCDGCLSARSAELTARVANDCKQHPYSIFLPLHMIMTICPLCAFILVTCFSVIVL